MVEPIDDKQTQNEQTQLKMNQEEKQERITALVLKNTVLADRNELRFGLKCVLEEETLSLVFTGDDGKQAGNAFRALLLDKGFVGLKELEERKQIDIDYRIRKAEKNSTEYVLKDLISEHFEGIILDEEDRDAILNEKGKAKPVLTHEAQSPETSVAANKLKINNAADKETGIASTDGAGDSVLPAAFDADTKVNKTDEERQATQPQQPEPGVNNQSPQPPTKEESIPIPTGVKSPPSPSGSRKNDQTPTNASNTEPPHKLKDICQFLRSNLPKSWQVKAAGFTLASAALFGVAIFGFFASCFTVVSAVAFAAFGVFCAACAIYSIVGEINGYKRKDKATDQSKNKKQQAGQLNSEPECPPEEVPRNSFAAASR